MRRPALLLLLALAAPAAADPAPPGSPRAAQPVPRAAAPVAEAGADRPRPRPEEERRCDADGAPCIAAATYAADVCRAIAAAAETAALDAGFLARLLWRESLFDAAAVSPKGAQGIAQFMPATAARRGLEDPFNPAEAIPASAAYLAELAALFGNLGLAAAAYNAGEARVARFLAGTSGLPGETRAYVLAITGVPAEAWRDALEGGAPAPDYALDPARPFQEACEARAAGRGMPEFRQPLRPWAVILAAQDSREAAERQASRLGPLLAGERVDYARQRVPGQARPRHTAQVGRDSRSEAEALCQRLRAGGAACLVLRN